MDKYTTIQIFGIATYQDAWETNLYSTVQTYDYLTNTPTSEDTSTYQNSGSWSKFRSYGVKVDPSNQITYIYCPTLIHRKHLASNGLISDGEAVADYSVPADPPATEPSSFTVEFWVNPVAKSQSQILMGFQCGAQEWTPNWNVQGPDTPDSDVLGSDMSGCCFLVKYIAGTGLVFRYITNSTAASYSQTTLVAEASFNAPVHIAIVSNKTQNRISVWAGGARKTNATYVTLDTNNHPVMSLYQVLLVPDYAGNQFVFDEFRVSATLRYGTPSTVPTTITVPSATFADAPAPLPDGTGSLTTYSPMGLLSTRTGASVPPISLYMGLLSSGDTPLLSSGTVSDAFIPQTLILFRGGSVQGSPAIQYISSDVSAAASTATLVNDDRWSLFGAMGVRINPTVYEGSVYFDVPPTTEFTVEFNVHAVGTMAANGARLLVGLSASTGETIASVSASDDGIGYVNNVNLVGYIHGNAPNEIAYGTLSRPAGTGALAADVFTDSGGGFVQRITIQRKGDTVAIYRGTDQFLRTTVATDRTLGRIRLMGWGDAATGYAYIYDEFRYTSAARYPGPTDTVADGLPALAIPFVPPPQLGNSIDIAPPAPQIFANTGAYALTIVSRPIVGAGVTGDPLSGLVEVLGLGTGDVGAPAFFYGSATSGDEKLYVTANYKFYDNENGNILNTSFGKTPTNWRSSQSWGFSQPTDVVTLEAWIYVSSSGPSDDLSKTELGQVWLETGGYSAVGFYVAREVYAGVSRAVIKFQYEVNVLTPTIISTQLVLSDWHQVTIQVANGRAEFWFDGVNQGGGLYDDNIGTPFSADGVSVQSSEALGSAVIYDEFRVTRTLRHITGAERITLAAESFGPLSTAVIMTPYAPMATVNANSGARVMCSAPKPQISATAAANTVAYLGGSAPPPVVGSWSGASVSSTTSSPTLRATAKDSTGEQAAHLTAPSPVLSFYTGAVTKNLRAPSPTLSTTGTVTGWGEANLSTPTPVLTAEGTVTGMATANLRYGYANGGNYGLESFGGGTASLTAPKPSLSSVSTTGGVARLTLTSPRPKLSTRTGAQANAACPSPSLTASAKVGGRATIGLIVPSPKLSISIGAQLALTAPSPALITTGYPCGASAQLTAPSPNLVGYGGAVCSVRVTGKPTLQATGTTGGVASAQVTCPLFELTATASVGNVATAHLVAPSPRLGQTIQAWLVAPSARLTAIGSAVITATYEAYAINLGHRPRVTNQELPIDEVTRYTNFPFTHVVRYQNSYYGANTTGLYLLEGTTDDGTPIPWAVKTAMDDFKTPVKKTVASAYFGGRFGPASTVQLHAGEDVPNTYSYTTPRDALAQNHRQVFGKGVKERYFALGASGTGTVELDTIELDTHNMTRRI